LKEKSHRLALKGHLDLIIVDNLQFIGAGEPNNANKNLDYINLKVLAHDLNVPILAGIQISGKIKRGSTNAQYSQI